MNKSILFYDPSFPYAGQQPDDDCLKALTQQFEVVGADQLSERLAMGADCLVSLHGPYFPKQAWNGILAHLQRAGGLLNIGGAPFRIPLYRENDQWVMEPGQTAYHQQLQIHEALPVDPTPIERFIHHEDLPLFAGKASLFEVSPTYGLVLHVTRANDHPQENGSSGPMDAHIYPLLKGLSRDGRKVAAPAVLLENTKGAFRGGRWIFINQTIADSFWNGGGVQAIKEWSQFCADGVTEIWLKPNYASYEPGERPTITIQLQTLKASAARKWSFVLKLAKDTDTGQEPVWEGISRLEASKELVYSRITLPVQLEPGYYRMECVVQSDTGEQRIMRQGFWGFDNELLSQGESVSCDRDYLWKDGRPMPVVGMTYMTSDVARKFLFMPNAAVWDKDMAQMKRAGINFIRTGIWTAWRNVMFIDGHPYEEVLRAIDAFILTAKKHDIEISFNFFAFTPELWEGTNPYLDPRSVEAQKRFIRAIVSRHARSTNVQWDLINEPSMFDPKRIFSGPKSSQDAYERAAFVEWLKERHGSIRRLQERWNMTPVELPDFSSVRPPEPSEINFNTTETTVKRGGKWLDYTLFTMEMHNRWAKELTAAIKSINPKQLVTVGQDEGLGAQRPSPFFYAEAVDYTTVHSWWLMDQLIWDGIFSKAPDKPNLIQETGIMYVETPDGRAKRSETELRNILERKYAYAFATGGAGAVQWLWNTNFYMDNVNESNIGALRADGTEKPEADVSYDFGKFMGEIRDLFIERRLEDVAVVFPYSNDFSNRKVAFEATTALTRTLTYEMKLPFRALSEYHLQSLQDQPPKVIIVPSAHNFSDDAFDKLMAHVEQYGGTLLITGPIGLDEYWRPKARLSGTIGNTQLTNVLREEALEINGKRVALSFGGTKIAVLNKEIITGTNLNSIALKELPIGKGRLVWSPLPVELNNRTQSMVELYSYVFSRADVRDDLQWNGGGDLPGVYGRKVSFRDGALFIFVSECGYDTAIKVTDTRTGKSYGFKLDSERTIMFAADRQGAILSVYRPEEVTVSTH